MNEDEMITIIALIFSLPIIFIMSKTIFIIIAAIVISIIKGQELTGSGGLPNNPTDMFVEVNGEVRLDG